MAISEKMAIEVIGRFPISIVVYTLLSGAVFLFLSPVRLYISTFVNPLFSGDTAANTLNNLVVLSLLSLFAGLPLLLLKDLVYSYKGVNEKIGWLWNRRKSSTKPHKKESLTFAELDISAAQLASFVKWTNETGLYHQLEFINVEAHVLAAFIVASEFSFLLDLVWIGGVIFLGQLPSLAGILTISLVASFLIGFPSWIYEKFYFRGYKRKRLKFVGDSFREIFPLNSTKASTANI